MSDITLLDGSIGQELMRRSGKAPTPLWSTSVMLDQPELVGALHDDFFAAGATIATTNSYALHPNRLERAGIPDKLDELVETAMQVALDARVRHGSGRVAGAMGPYLATYRPDLNPDVEEAAARYRTLGSQLAAKCDLLLAETVSSLTEAEGILRGIDALDIPRWLAVSTKDDDGARLRSGEHLSEIAPLVEKFRPDALLINCTRPEMVAEGLDIIAQMGVPVGAYANGFTHIADGFLQAAPTVDSLEARKDLTPEAYADFALRWIDHGATILGGCCEISPAHIAELANRLHADGHRIV